MLQRKCVINLCPNSPISSDLRPILKLLLLSSVCSIKTSAKRVGDDLIINGSKMWITNAYQADWVCLLVNTEPDKPVHMNKSLVCVPMDSKGITLAKRIDKMGMRASDTGIIYFEDVRVPIANIIGQEGYGFTYQMMQVHQSSISLLISY